VTTSLSLFGLGYVGSVTAACLASKGNRVLGVDVNPAKVAIINAGKSPVLEKGLNELVEESHKACRLYATESAQEAVLQTEVSFICVGTPSQSNGKLDLAHVEQVCRDIGQALRRKDKPHSIVLRSTVPPGTTESLVIPLLERESGKRAGVGFDVSFNPEFLREGAAISDFFEPTITVLGALDPAHLCALRQLYDWVPGKTFETSLATAESIKLICNAYHALKVAFANEVGTLCKQMGVDTEGAIEAFKADTRLNASAAYLNPGFAFGGSCLPKDLRAISHRAKELDLRLPLLESILPSNQMHIERALNSILRAGKKNVGVLGLSFKSGTDDLRESPIVQLIKRLIGEGCQIKVWDPDVSLGKLVGSNRQYIEDYIPHIGSLLVGDWQSVVAAAEVVVLATRSVKTTELASLIRPEQTLVDLITFERALRPQLRASYEGICW